MLNIDEALRNIYKNDYWPNASSMSTKELIIHFPGINLTIGNDQIYEESFQLSESICSTDDLTFGACEAAQMKITLADVEVDITGLECVITQRINGIYTMPLGTYKVQSAKKRNDKRFKDVIAYDNIESKLKDDVIDWYNALFKTASSCSLKQFRISLFAHVGIEIEDQTLPNDNMIITKTFEGTILIARDVAKAIGEVNGRFGHMTRANKFKYIGLSGLGLYPSETLYPSEDLYPSEAGETLGTVGYKALDYEEYVVNAIDKLIIRNEDGDIGYTVGTGENPYIIQANFLLYKKTQSELTAIAQNIFDNIKNKYYRPHNSIIPGLPYLEVGDAISIITTKDVIETFVFQRILTGIQALQDDITATGNEYREQDFGYQAQLSQLQAKTVNIVKSVDEVSATLKDTSKDLEASIGLLQGEVNLKVSSNGIVQAINLSPEGAKIDVTKLDITGIVTMSDLKGSTLTINGGKMYIPLGGAIYLSNDFGNTNYGAAVYVDSSWGCAFGNTNRGDTTIYGKNWIKFNCYSNTVGSSYGVVLPKNTYIAKPQFGTEGSVVANMDDLDNIKTSTIYVDGSTASYLKLNSSKQLVPNLTSDNYSIGNASYPFTSGYFKNIYLNGNAMDLSKMFTPDYSSYYLQLNGSRELVPSTNSSSFQFHLGNSSYPFASMYVKNIYHQTGGTLGFFGKTPISRKSITKLSASADESAMRNKINELLDGLGATTSGYGLYSVS